VNQRQFADAYALSFTTDRPFTAEELLRAHAHMRGWVLDHGRADNSRSSRIILKDFVKVIHPSVITIIVVLRHLFLITYCALSTYRVKYCIVTLHHH
jgi:hypothetical protein